METFINRLLLERSSIIYSTRRKYISNLTCYALRCKPFFMTLTCAFVARNNYYSEKLKESKVYEKGLFKKLYRHCL